MLVLEKSKKRWDHSSRFFLHFYETNSVNEQAKQNAANVVRRELGGMGVQGWGGVGCFREIVGNCAVAYTVYEFQILI